MTKGPDGPDAKTLRLQVLDVLRRTLGFDAYVWLLTDPVSSVGAAPLADVPCLSELPTLIKCKYATDVNRWTVLAREPTPAGLLHRAVGGDLSRSLVWREVMSRYDIGDVASVVFADRFGCWGFLDLWRYRDTPVYDNEDAALLSDIAGPLTEGLRRCQAGTFTEPATPHRRDLGPLVMLLDDDLEVVSRTEASQQWLDVLIPPRPAEPAIPASVYNVAAQLLAVEDGIDDNEAYARVHLADGFWVTLRAARLNRTDAGASIAVTIEETSPVDRLDVFARAYGLSARESELLGLLATGGDTREVAQQMFLSEHTVQDHLKSIFAKTGARNRITLLSRALGTQTGQLRTDRRPTG